MSSDWPTIPPSYKTPLLNKPTPIPVGQTTPVKNGSPQGILKKDNECEDNEALLLEAALRQSKAAAAELAAPIMVARLIVNPKIALDNAASPLAAVLASAANSPNPLSLNGVPITEIDPLFGDYFSVTLAEPVAKAQAQAYSSLLMSTGNFVTAELDLPAKPLDYQLEKSVDKAAAFSSPTRLWHLLGSEGASVFSSQGSHLGYNLMRGGGNVLNAWSAMQTTPATTTVAVIDNGVWEPSAQDEDPLDADAPRLLPGYNFITDSDYKLWPGHLELVNNQPADVRNSMDVATRSVRKVFWSWICKLCSGPPFNGTGPDGHDWDEPTKTGTGFSPRAATESDFYNGAWIGDGSHGSAVAHLISEYSSSGALVPGVVHNTNVGLPQMTSDPHSTVNILPIRILTNAEFVQGLLYAAGMQVSGALPNDHPAEVINVSLGMGDTCPKYMIDAIAEVIKAGKIVVASAGNESQRGVGHVPASCPGVISVASNTWSGRLSSFSNVASYTTIAAPGGGQECEDEASMDIPVLQPVQGGSRNLAQFSAQQGTSFSAPIVAGAIAIEKSIFPALTAQQAIDDLQETGRDFDRFSTCRKPNSADYPYCKDLKIVNVEGLVYKGRQRRNSTIGLSPNNANSNNTGALNAPRNDDSEILTLNPFPKSGLLQNKFKGRNFQQTNNTDVAHMTVNEQMQLPAASIAQHFFEQDDFQIASLSNSQLTDVSAAQVAQRFKKFTQAQIGALTDQQLTMLSADDVVLQFSALPWARLNNLRNDQLSALTPAQKASFIKQLTPAQAAQRMGMLTVADIALLSAAQVAASINAMTPAQRAALSGAQLSALTAVEVETYFRQFNALQIGALSDAQLTTLTAADVTWGFSSLPWARLDNLSNAQLSGLTSAQRTSFVAQLLPNQAVLRMGMLTSADMPNLSAAAVAQMFVQMSSAQRRALTPAQLPVLTLAFAQQQTAASASDWWSVVPWTTLNAQFGSNPAAIAIIAHGLTSAQIDNALNTAAFTASTMLAADLMQTQASAWWASASWADINAQFVKHSAAMTIVAKSLTSAQIDNAFNTAAFSESSLLASDLSTAQGSAWWASASVADINAQFVKNPAAMTIVVKSLTSAQIDNAFNTAAFSESSLLASDLSTAQGSAWWTSASVADINAQFVKNPAAMTIVAKSLTSAQIDNALNTPATSYSALLVADLPPAQTSAWWASAQWADINAQFVKNPAAMTIVVKSLTSAQIDNAFNTAAFSESSLLASDLSTAQGSAWWASASWADINAQFVKNPAAITIVAKSLTSAQIDNAFNTAAFGYATALAANLAPAQASAWWASAPWADINAQFVKNPAAVTIVVKSLTSAQIDNAFNTTAFSYGAALASDLTPSQASAWWASALWTDINGMYVRNLAAMTAITKGLTNVQIDTAFNTATFSHAATLAADLAPAQASAWWASAPWADINAQFVKNPAAMTIVVKSLTSAQINNAFNTTAFSYGAALAAGLAPAQASGWWASAPWADINSLYLKNRAVMTTIAKGLTNAQIDNAFNTPAFSYSAALAADLTPAQGSAWWAQAPWSEINALFPKIATTMAIIVRDLTSAQRSNALTSAAFNYKGAL